MIRDILRSLSVEQRCRTMVEVVSRTPRSIYLDKTCHGPFHLSWMTGAPTLSSNTICSQVSSNRPMARKSRRRSDKSSMHQRSPFPRALSRLVSPIDWDRDEMPDHPVYHIAHIRHANDWLDDLPVQKLDHEFTTMLFAQLQLQNVHVETPEGVRHRGWSTDGSFQED